MTTQDSILKTPTHYDIIDAHTGVKVATSKSRAGATRAADKRDLNYGAYRFVVKPIYA